MDSKPTPEMFLELEFGRAHAQLSRSCVAHLMPAIESQVELDIIQECTGQRHDDWLSYLYNSEAEDLVSVMHAYMHSNDQLPLRLDGVDAEELARVFFRGLNHTIGIIEEGEMPRLLAYAA